MEYFLSIVIILLLLLQRSRSRKDRVQLQDHIDTLNDKLDGLNALLNKMKATKSVNNDVVDAIENDPVTPVVDFTVTEAPVVTPEPTEPPYTPTYTQAAQLSVKDIGVIKSIFKTAEETHDFKTLIPLRAKVIDVLALEDFKAQSDKAFISTIIADYDYYIEHPLDVTPTVEAVAETATSAPNFDATQTVIQSVAEPPKAEAPKLSVWERFKQKNPDLEKFIGENLINKIGILILVLGISYFVKFAIDKNWINEPARVGIGILAGSLVLFIAHKLRQKYAPFSSVLVAGAIAIFYFTIAIAFHEYQLFGQEVAFAIMVVITAFSCLISLSYNRMELAILSLIGGFAVPFMISTGSGNYVVLFTYIAILDIGILILAYFKKWQLLHILAFIFTIILFGGWVVTDVNSDAPHYLGALVFGFVFYVIFIVMNIINNLRSKGRFTNLQLSMLTINNGVFYGVGMLVLSYYKPEYTGLFTAFLAVLNMGYSLLLFKKFGLDKRGIYLLIGLSLTFITLAIPVQFSGHSITIFWAIEAVMLLWLSQKSQIKSYSFVAVIVQLLMLGSLLMDWEVYFTNSELGVVLNPLFMAGILVVASFIGVHLLLRKDTETVSQFGLHFNPVFYRTLTGILAVIVGYFVGLAEVLYQALAYYDFNDALAISVQYHMLFTAVFCFLSYRKRTLKTAKLVSVIAIVNIIVFAVLCIQIPFTELEDHIILGTTSRIAYYLHMVCFVFMIYFWLLVYRTNTPKKVFPLFNHKLTLWFAVSILVLITSAEVVLQGLHIMGFSSAQDPLALDYGEFVSSHYKIIKTGLPVLWGVLAFGLLLWGIKKQLKQLRIIALSLLGLTIVKLFVYDISNVSETGKIIAFILLGVLILIISFIYQKIKVLVTDEDKTPEDETID
ncbi:DUF2339 domain-containing protein [uncultured Formosa sp.]|uniref:DUF2339 domain-containing protein n=1 Tax=uncultured Formosa sp. TaxID=255435 RepID=UPI00262B3B1C|nr:DUF2339 domain-containing protein [uncultured Formosa sp.]